MAAFAFKLSFPSRCEWGLKFEEHEVTLEDRLENSSEVLSLLADYEEEDAMCLDVVVETAVEPSSLNSVEQDAGCSR